MAAAFDIHRGRAVPVGDLRLVLPGQHTAHELVGAAQPVPGLTGSQRTQDEPHEQDDQPSAHAATAAAVSAFTAARNVGNAYAA